MRLINIFDTILYIALDIFFITIVLIVVIAALFIAYDELIRKKI